MKHKITNIIILLFVASSLSAELNYDILVRAEIEKYRNNRDSIESLNKAFEYLPKLSSSRLKGDIYYLKSDNEMKRGCEVEAHTNLYKAIEYYQEDNSAISKQWTSVCYYSLSISFLNQKDTLGLKNILEKMDIMRNENPDLNSIHYDYHSVLAVYYTLLFEASGKREEIDLFLLHTKKAIYYLEQMTLEERIELSVNSCWVYYNIAVTYDLNFEPKKVDSVLYYLQLTRDAMSYLTKERDVMEVEISVFDEYAWIHMYLKDYDKAEDYMNRVLSLLDSVETHSPNTVITERSEAYLFFVELYETICKPKKALEYQKLLNINDRKRYDVERNNALNDIRVKYEVDKKDADIKYLRLQNNVMRLMILIGTIIIALFVLVYFLLKMRKRNKEQQHYEAALVADSLRDAKSLTVQIILDRLKLDFPNYYQALDSVNVEQLTELMNSDISKLTTMDKRYTICFMADMNVHDIASMFNIEPASVYTVKYRLKKKFPAGKLPF